MMNVKKDDVVIRMLAGTIPMRLKVTEIDDNFIYCGPWKFDKKTGAEVDEDLPQLQSLGMCASYIKVEGQPDFGDWSKEDQKKFAESILNPPPIAPAMERAAQRHQEIEDTLVDDEDKRWAEKSSKALKAWRNDDDEG